MRPRNLRKPTPARCKAYWDDFVQMWRVIGVGFACDVDGW